VGINIETSALLWEPFIQGFVGKGYTKSKTLYEWNTHLAGDYETYQSFYKEDISYYGMALGIAAFAKNGFTSSLKFSKNIFTIGDREVRLREVYEGETVTFTSYKESINENLDKIMVSLQMGYIF
jgi:hypothetical protein